MFLKLKFKESPSYRIEYRLQTMLLPHYIMRESECLTLNIFISVLHLNVVDQLRNAAEDKATKILREKLKFTTSAKSAGGKARGKYPV